VTVARKPGHRGERGVSRKPLRREGRDASAEPVCSCAFFCACLHTRPRVQRAPGFPCALFFQRAAIDAKLGRIAPRECGRTSTRCMTIELEIHTHVISGKRLVRRSSQRRRKRDPSIGIHGVDGFREGLNPSYELQGFGGSLGWNAALPSHHPHRSCGWLRQAKAAESVIAVPAFYFPAAQDGWSEAIPINCYWSVDGFRKGLNPSYELLPLARSSSAVAYGWVASYSLCMALRSCGLPAPVFESRHDRNYKDIAHTDRLVRAARFGQERAG